jgi:S-adenosylmethionine hydrolase
VDPGVGSERRPIAVRTRDYSFVGPDNGLLSQALASEQVLAVRRLDNTSLFRQPVSQTFHGRDIFAPVAARLSRGLAFAKLGERVEDYQRLLLPEVKLTPSRVSGEIVYLDRFGNALTNLQASHLETLGGSGLAVAVARRRALPVVAFYQAVPVGEPLATLGSSGRLEIAINGGNAAREMKLRVGDTVLVSRNPRTDD